MNKLSTLLLRIAIIAAGAVVLLLCVFALPAMWRAVPAEYPDHTYVFYCILAAMYVSAVPFYGALYQALRLLQYIDANKAFSSLSVRSLKQIALCALTISALYATSTPFFYIWAQGDDAPGLVVIAMILVAAPFIIGIFAAVLQRLLNEALNIKSENDLTV